MRRAILRNAAAILVGAATLFVADGASADDKALADQALVSGRPQEALDIYRQLYEQTGDPALLYNMGRAHQALGDPASALDQLERFEREAPAELRARVPGLPALLADLRRRMSELSFSCDVADAEVSLDGRVLGRTPLGRTFRVRSGGASLRVAKPGYYTVERSIFLPPGGMASIDLHLASTAIEGVLRIRSPIAGAAVAIDGKSAGTVPTEVVLAGGPHDVLVTRDGFDSSRSSVVVRAGETHTLDVELTTKTPITKTWWFWTGLGVIVAGGIATAVIVTTEREASTGTLAPGRISAGLTF